MFSKRSLLAALSLAFAPSLAQAQISDGIVKIGVLSDMSSLYSDIGGGGARGGPRHAVAGFPTKSQKVELPSAGPPQQPHIRSSDAPHWEHLRKVGVNRRVPASPLP